MLLKTAGLTLGQGEAVQAASSPAVGSFSKKWPGTCRALAN